jgi:hypothetical protein
LLFCPSTTPSSTFPSREDKGPGCRTPPSNPFSFFYLLTTPFLGLTLRSTSSLVHRTILYFLDLAVSHPL